MALILVVIRTVDSKSFTVDKFIFEVMAVIFFAVAVYSVERALIIF